MTRDYTYEIDRDPAPRPERYERDDDPVPDLAIVPRYQPELHRDREIEHAIYRHNLRRERPERPAPIHWIDA